MSMLVKALIGLAVIAAVVTTVVVAGSDEDQPKDTVATQKATPSARASAAPRQSTVEVKYTASGFSPSTITVKSGQSILFNNQGVDLMVASDPHPTHDSNPELNLERALSSKGMLVTLTTKGTFTFHDHLMPQNKGTVTVE